MVLQSVVTAKKITRNAIKAWFSHSCTLQERDKKKYYSLNYIMAKHKIINNRNIPSRVHLQVLGSGTKGGCTSLLLITDHKKYLFNCGEGTQRLSNEHRCKLSKIKNIFITSAIWKHIGGLPGVILTLQSINSTEKSNENIIIQAPKGVDNMLKVLKDSSIMTQLQVSMDNPDVCKEYSDDAMTVSCIPIYPNTNDTCKHISETTNDNINDDTSNINGKRRHEEHRIDKRIKSSEQNVPVLSFICRLHDKLGALNLEKCFDLGLKPGPVLGKLKYGKEVTLDDGTIIKHEDVCNPDEKGATFIVVDCPNKNYIESFVNHTAFKKYQKNAPNEDDKPFCIVHFTPQEIIDNPKYRDWINNFDSNTYHLIINESNTCLGSEAVYKQQHILNILHPKIFPYLNSKSFQNPVNMECQKIDTDNIQKIYYAKTLQTVSLRPELKFETEVPLMVDPDRYIDEVYELDDFSNTLTELQSNISEEMKSLLDIEEYPQVIMLGTGSSVPSKVRNTSSILVKIDENHSILLDCSEGTLCQITRLYGHSKLNQILANIKAIYVSHIHADHHLGLIAILQARARVTKDPVFVLIPNNLRSWLQVYHKYVEPIEDYFKLLSNQDLSIEKHTLPPFIENELYTALNLKKIDTCLVKHCPFAYAISLAFKNDKKIVYSGDTMPCANMTKLGKNCDLLIHEATLQDELIKEARIKKHTTTSEAIKMGEEMGAGFTLLTHFSQRHAKIPILPKETKADLSKVGIAYDYMHFSLSQLKLLPLFHSCLKIIFSDYLVQTENRIMRRNRREKQCK